MFLKHTMRHDPRKGSDLATKPVSTLTDEHITQQKQATLDVLSVHDKRNKTYFNKVETITVHIQRDAKTQSHIISGPEGEYRETSDKWSKIIHNHALFLRTRKMPTEAVVDSPKKGENNKKHKQFFKRVGTNILDYAVYESQLRTLSRKMSMFTETDLNSFRKSVERFYTKMLSLEGDNQKKAIKAFMRVLFTKYGCTI